ncbi:MAG: DUF423 domain-containing protein [Gammaproteobacteria bacterium]
MIIKIDRIRALRPCTMTLRIQVALAAISGFVAVAAGAFGAHFLKARLAPDALQIFETGARYQMYHALALLAVACVTARAPSAFGSAAGWLFVAGTVVFSGSLYALALTGWRGLGAVTPFGGVALLVAWICLLAAAMKM